MTAPDRSRALERTALAWNRTGLSFIAVGAAVLRLLGPSGRGAVGGAMVVVGAAVSAYAWRPHERDDAARAVRLLALATTAVAGGVLVAAALP